MSTTEAGGAYLYAVLDGARAEIDYGAIGIDNGEVRCVIEGDLAAAVSAVTRPRLRPERKLLAAHQGVLRRLMEGTTVLPASFGLVADDEGAVRRILRANQEALREQLDHVAGKVEMGLRVLWSAPDLFGYFVEAYPELREARDRAAKVGSAGAAGRDAMIDVGMRFDQIRSADRDAHAARVVASLEGAGVEVKQNEPRGDREVMNLACLVRRADQGSFEGALAAAAAGFDDNFTFDYSGPWAPFSFTELRIHL